MQFPAIKSYLADVKCLTERRSTFGASSIDHLKSYLLCVECPDHPLHSDVSCRVLSIVCRCARCNSAALQSSIPAIIGIFAHFGYTTAPVSTRVAVRWTMTAMQPQENENNSKLRFVIVLWSSAALLYLLWIYHFPGNFIVHFFLAATSLSASLRSLRISEFQTNCKCRSPTRPI